MPFSFPSVSVSQGRNRVFSAFSASGAVKAETLQVFHVLGQTKYEKANTQK